MWNSQLDAIKNSYFDLGRKYCFDMYQANQSRQFPRGAWDALGDAGLFNNIIQYDFNDAVSRIAASLQGFAKGSNDACFNIATVCHSVLGLRLINEHASQSVKKNI